MTRFFFARIAPFALALAIGACSETQTDPGPTAPSPTPSPSPSPSPSPAPSPSCTASANLPTFVSARGGAFPFSLTIGSNCAWTARTDVTWADVTPGSGQGNHALLFQVGEHSRRDGRTVNVIINGQAFRITQDPIGCVYTLSVATLEAADQGGRLDFMIDTPVGCGWAATSSDSWISVRTPNGTGEETIVLQIAPNTGDVRQGFVTIAGQRVNITQRRG